MDVTLLSVHAGRRRAQRLYPALPPCERCGGDKAERHHKDANTMNNLRQNIEFICRRCHMQADGRMAAFADQAKLRIETTTALAAAARTARSHCKRGHPLSGDNLYVKPNGSRICIACRKLQKATK